MTSVPGRPLILARRPSPRLADGELTHIDRIPVDPDLALTQWQGYLQAFRDAGWEVREIEPADDHPDGVFLEDAMVVFGDLVVLTSPGAVSRRGEIDTATTAAERLRDERGFSVARIEEPGYLDGGDILKIGTDVYAGTSSRTNAAGIDQLRRLLEPRGWTVIAVPVTRVLHLKSGVTALPDGTVVGYEPLVDDPSMFRSFLGVPEEHGTAVVDLGEGRILMSDDAPATAALYADRGWKVTTVGISEFEKLEGCVTCLSVRVRRG